MSHPRFVDVGRTFNFRDLGGYPTEGGGSVRWRTLYRADVPVTPTETDRHELGALNLRTVIDLRAASETGPRNGHVDDATEHHTLAVGMADDWQLYDAGVDLRRFLADRYLLTAERSAAQLGAAVCLIADRNRVPLLMHCHRGRDRTGVLAALVLALLGVPDEVIAQEYALSTIGVERAFGWLRTNQPDVALPAPHLVATPAEAMSWFLHDLRDRHGGIEAYVTAAGVELAQLKAMRAHLVDE